MATMTSLWVSTTQAAKGLCLFVCLCFLAGCGADVQIVSPADQSVSDQPPEFRLRFRNPIPDDFTASINGKTLTASQFSQQGQDAFIQLSRDQLRAGNNEFKVIQPVEVASIFYFDIVGPQVHVLGATGDNPKQVAGYLSDRSDPARLTINGQEIPLQADHRFNASISKADLYSLVATDSLGYESTHLLAKLDRSYNPAIGVRINRQGLEESLPNAILSILENTDFKQVIDNPVTNPCSNTPIVKGCARLNIDDLQLTPGSQIRIQALSGDRLRVFFDLSQVDVDTRLTTYAKCNGFPCFISGEFGKLNLASQTTVRNTRMAVDFALNINQGNISVRLVEGSLDIDLPLNGIAFNFDLGIIEDIPIAGSVIKSAVNSIISNSVSIFSSIFIDIFDGFLSTPVSLLINQLLANLMPDSITLPIADTSLTLGFSAEDFSTTNGGLDLTLANSLSIAAIDNGVLPPLGSAFVVGERPKPYPTFLPNNESVDLTATLSLNLINQVLTEAYKGGMLNITLDQSNGLQVGAIANLPDAPLDLVGVSEFNIRISGATPPSVRLLPQAEQQDGILSLSLLDMNIQINANFNDGRGLQTILDTTVDLLTPFDVDVSTDSKLRIGIETVPEVQVQDFRFQLGGLVLSGGSNTSITNLIARITPILIPKALEAMGGIPLPTFQGFSFQLKDIWNPNNNNAAFMSLGGNLVSVAAQANALAPSITANIATTAEARAGLALQSQLPAPTQSVNMATHSKAIKILLDGFNPETEPLSYRYRLNKTAWTVWKERDHIELSHLQPGRHQLEICTRTALLKQACTKLDVPVAASLAPQSANP